MEVKLIDYPSDGMHKIAEMTRATKKNKFEYSQSWEPKEDNEFIKLRIKEEHLGVLEHITFTFHVSEVSRCLSHQLVRHRIASYLQMSNRYVKADLNEFVTPPSIEKHASIDLRKEYLSSIKDSYHTYSFLMAHGVPREDARYVLPPAFFTHISITMNAHSLLQFLEARLDKAAQWEIREMACKLFDIIYERYPILFESVKELRDKNKTN